MYTQTPWSVAKILLLVLSPLPFWPGAFGASEAAPPGPALAVGGCEPGAPACEAAYWTTSAAI